MYDIPPEFDLTPLVGTSIDAVTLGPHWLRIMFGEDRSVSGSGTVAYRHGSDLSTIRDREWQDLNLLKSLLGAEVESWKRESDHSFSVSLRERGTLVFTDETPQQYESFEIQPEGWVI